MPGSGAFGRVPHGSNPQLPSWLFPLRGERVNPGGWLDLLCSVTSPAPTSVSWYTDTGTLLATRTAAPWGARVYDVPECSRIRCAVTVGGVTRSYWRPIRCSRAIPNGYVPTGAPAIAVIPDVVAPIGSGYVSNAANLGSLGGMFKAFPVAASDRPVVTSYPNITDAQYGTRSANLLPIRIAARANGSTVAVFGSDGSNANRQLRTTLGVSSTRFVHDGSGCSIYAVVRRTSAAEWEILGSSTGSPPGMQLVVTSTGALALRVWSLGGTQIVNATTTATLSLDTTYVVSASYGTAGVTLAIYDGATVTRQTFAGATFSTGNGGTAVYVARSLTGYQGATLAFAARHDDATADAQLAALWAVEGSVTSCTPVTGRRLIVRGDCWSVGTWDVSYNPNGWATYGWQSYLPGRDYEVISLGKYEPYGLTEPSNGIAALASTEVYPLVTSGAIVPVLLDGDDFVYHGQSGASLHTAVTNYLGQILSRGGVTLRTTMPPRVASYSAGAETARVAYNTATRASQPNASAYLDLDDVFVGTFGASRFDGVLYSNGGASDDGGHPTDLGYRLWGHLIGQQLLAV